MSELDALVDKLADKVLARVMEKLVGDEPEPAPAPVHHPGPVEEPVEVADDEQVPVSAIGEAFRARTPAVAPVSPVTDVTWEPVAGTEIPIEGGQSSGHRFTEAQAMAELRRNYQAIRTAVPVEDEMARRSG